jgi:D-alanyl-D-alanine carboxypeptidase
MRFILNLSTVILFACGVGVWQPATALDAIASATTTAKAPPKAALKIDAAAIENAMATHMREQSIPGVGMAIVHNGKAVYAKGFGRANLEHDIPVTTDSMFLIASVSKPMIAMGIVLLAQQGKLSIDDPVAKYIADTPKAWSGVTLKHLMQHTSGIVRESPAFDGNKQQRDIDLITATFAAPLDFATNTKLQYCNICYFTLAEVITRVSGQPWSDFMAKQIFTPAGMAATRTASTSAVIPNRVASYSFKDGVYSVEREYLALRPSGAFASSINDLVKWEQAIFEQRILNAESLARLTQPAVLNDGSTAKYSTAPVSAYGLGWVLSTFDGQPHVWHGGTLAGFRTIFSRYPESGITIILLTNSTSARVQSIEKNIAEIVFAK